MSYLSEKFNIPENTVKAMIKTGVISCSWEGYEEVIKLHKQGKSLSDIAIETGRCKTGVHTIIQKYKNM
jgi:predicted CopG family antitoxin